MYQVFLTKEAVKRIKKQGKVFKKKVTPILEVLAKNPTQLQVEKLSGELSFVYSYHFGFSGTSFRLAYMINEKEKKITVLLVAPRENFYKILKERLSSS